LLKKEYENPTTISPDQMKSIKRFRYNYFSRPAFLCYVTTDHMQKKLTRLKLLCTHYLFFLVPFLFSTNIPSLHERDTCLTNILAKNGNDLYGNSASPIQKHHSASAFSLCIMVLSFENTSFFSFGNLARISIFFRRFCTLPYFSIHDFYLKKKKTLFLQQL
jgi:hypothetical protein